MDDGKEADGEPVGPQPGRRTGECAEHLGTDREGAGGGRCLQVADALGVAPELLDCGTYRRGMSEGKYRLVLVATGHERSGWEAMIEAWGWTNDEGRIPPDALTARFNTTLRTKGATAEEALDAVENELRADPGEPGHTIEPARWGTPPLRIINVIRKEDFPRDDGP
jgi:hypothetical protein